MTSEFGEMCEAWVAPVRPLVLTSLFGPRPRRRADGTPGPLHPGVDAACCLGQMIFAVASGDVSRSYLSPNDPPEAKPSMPRPATWPKESAWPRQMGFGETVLITHPDGTQTRYAHLSRRLVEAGEHVERGQPIGLAGTTGWSSGVHLHFEVRRDRGILDPLPLLAHLNPLLA